jgi:hypothetical protein
MVSLAVICFTIVLGPALSPIVDELSWIDRLAKVDLKQCYAV